MKRQNKINLFIGSIRIPCSFVFHFKWLDYCSLTALWFIFLNICSLKSYYSLNKEPTKLFHAQSVSLSVWPEAKFLPIDYGVVVFLFFSFYAYSLKTSMSINCMKVSEAMESGCTAVHVNPPMNVSHKQTVLPPWSQLTYWQYFTKP